MYRTTQMLETKFAHFYKEFEFELTLGIGSYVIGYILNKENPHLTISFVSLLIINSYLFSIAVINAVKKLSSKPETLSDKKQFFYLFFNVICFLILLFTNRKLISIAISFPLSFATATLVNYLFTKNA